MHRVLRTGLDYAQWVFFPLAVILVLEAIHRVSVLGRPGTDVGTVIQIALIAAVAGTVALLAHHKFKELAPPAPATEVEEPVDERMLTIASKAAQEAAAQVSMTVSNAISDAVRDAAVKEAVSNAIDTSARDAAMKLEKLEASLRASGDELVAIGRSVKELHDKFASLESKFNVEQVTVSSPEVSISSQRTAPTLKNPFLVVPTGAAAVEMPEPRTRGEPYWDRRRSRGQEDFFAADPSLERVVVFEIRSKLAEARKRTGADVSPLLSEIEALLARIEEFGVSDPKGKPTSR